MMISAIVMIPIPIEHVSAEDLYSIEETAEHTKPIILPVEDDSFDSINTTYDDTTYDNIIDDDTTYDDTIDDDTTYDDTTDDDTTYDETDDDTTDDAITDDDITYIDLDDINDINDNDMNNIENDVSDSIQCESCDEECICDICEFCEEECICDVIDFSMLRSEILIAMNVNSRDFLNRIIQGSLTGNDANNFVGDANNATIGAAIRRGDPVIIQISQSFNMSAAITVLGPRNITLISQENTQNASYTLTANGFFRHFIINENANMTLYNIVLSSVRPANMSANLVRGGIDVNRGTLILEAGAKIENNTNNRTAATGGGGGVNVSNGGTFIMNGGEILGNQARPQTAVESRGGGGVFVVGSNALNKSTFIMHGGEIKNNSATMNAAGTHYHSGGGGIHVADFGVFEITGGYITKNSMSPPTGNFASHNGGGGVFIAEKGEMQMTGGVISENEVVFGSNTWQGGGGIYTRGKVTMDGGRIHKNTVGRTGGGVYVAQTGEFIMFKGEITYNEALSTSLFCGGGVMIAGGTFRTANHPNEKPGEKIISYNYGATNGGGFVVRARHENDYNGPGLLEIVDGTVITGNNVSPNVYIDNSQHATGGAIWLGGHGTLRLYGGEIYDNIGGNSKGISWIQGTINLQGNPRVGGNTDIDPDYIHRYNLSDPPNQVMNIVAPLGDNAHINVRDDNNDRARPNSAQPFTVIARIMNGVPATEIDATRFHYIARPGSGRETWGVVARDPGNDSDLILDQNPPPPPTITKFALLSVPDSIHFGIRPLLTTNLVGPYGDAPQASNVTTDFTAGMESWQFGFEVANTTHDGWSVILKATPFVNDDGIVGAIPIALRNGEANPTPNDLTQASIKIYSSNIKAESIKWHWTQMQYKIEAQTKLDTVTPENFKSVFTWNLVDAP